ncbi:thioredoxin family protein [Evansella cellulosilytica]|uniref:Thioredoxin domain-containing protein n=1 Tax=Evansella cellulosilytica (strain ATCC 21833 / DSM 2522 / FERM P-1141 / JCM 9156 / N-4) TaxID=649639 RepID=E6TT57_EVAC2|nr:thioredoxin family protein [Evansella cellulosilytica]ADU31965.1 hypothetical protein Bcell_3725 [Evansella cellulosilytica DSM 2522]
MIKYGYFFAILIVLIGCGSYEQEMLAEEAVVKAEGLAEQLTETLFINENVEPLSSLENIDEQLKNETKLAYEEAMASLEEIRNESKREPYLVRLEKVLFAVEEAENFQLAINKYNEVIQKWLDFESFVMKNPLDASLNAKLDEMNELFSSKHWEDFDDEIKLAFVNLLQYASTEEVETILTFQQQFDGLEEWLFSNPSIGEVNDMHDEMTELVALLDNPIITEAYEKFENEMLSSFYDWKEYEAEVKAFMDIVKEEQIISLDAETEPLLWVILENSEYVSLLFYTDGCFVNTQSSHFSLKQQSDLAKKYPEMIFINVRFHDHQELAKFFSITETPFKIIFKDGDSKVGFSGFMEMTEVEQLYHDVYNDKY